MYPNFKSTMRQNTVKRKFKPNPGENLRHTIRSSSIRDIIGDRRFNAQFIPANTHGIEGTKKVKRVNVGDPESDDLPNLGHNASSIQCEDKEAPRHVGAKTVEYAFFKRLRENSSSNVHTHPKYHDNQLNNVEQSGHLTTEIPHVQKESSKYARSSLPIKNERNNAQYSFLSPPFDGSKIAEVNQAFESGCTKVQKVNPGGYNWLSPSMGSKTKTSGNKGVFSAKREKLRQWISDKSLYEVNEKGFDLVSVLISRILPQDQKNNCDMDPTDSKHKQPSFFEFESATPIKNYQSNKRRLFECDRLPYLDNDLSISTNRFNDSNLLEPSSITRYNRNFAIENISSFDKPLYGYESVNNLIKEQPHTLLLGWEDKSEKHEIDVLSTSATSTHDMLISSPPSSPYYHLRGLEEEHFMRESTSPYNTPKRLMMLEDSRIKFTEDNNTWYQNESSFLYLIQSPANNLLQFLNTGLHSFFLSNHSEEWRKAFRSSGYMEMEPFHLDQIGYPLLLHDSDKL